MDFYSKFFPFVFLIMTAGCGVELRDKNEDSKPKPEVRFNSTEDIIWNEPVSFTQSEVIKARRLTIKRNAVITTNDFSLNLQVDELIVEGGVIQSFAQDAQASWERTGRTGGNIQIKARYATGLLHVFLRGENGGHGKNGAITRPPHPGCAGTNGGDGGNSGSLNVDIENNQNFLVEFKIEEGKAGLRGERGSVPEGNPESVVNSPCYSEAPLGINGKAGHKGLVCLKISAGESLNCE